MEKYKEANEKPLKKDTQEPIIDYCFVFNWPDVVVRLKVRVGRFDILLTVDFIALYSVHSVSRADGNDY